VTRHPRNQKRVGGYDTQCVVALVIPWVAVMQRKKCCSLIRCHRARRRSHEILRGYASPWHHEQSAFSRQKLAARHTARCYTTFSFSSDVFDAEAAGVGLVDGTIRGLGPALRDHFREDARRNALHAPCGNSRKQDVVRDSHVCREPRRGDTFRKQLDGRRFFGDG
jgi:hypothetical protein